MSQAVSNNHLQIVFSPLFTGSLRCVWVRLVYIILDYDYKLYSRLHCSPYTVYLDFPGDYPLS